MYDALVMISSIVSGMLNGLFLNLGNVTAYSLRELEFPVLISLLWIFSYFIIWNSFLLLRSRVWRSRIVLYRPTFGAFLAILSCYIIVTSLFELHCQSTGCMFMKVHIVYIRHLFIGANVIFKRTRFAPPPIFCKFPSFSSMSVHCRRELRIYVHWEVTS
jgi:hypothetical protein